MRLKPSFFLGEDVVHLAKQLIGKRLVTHLDGQLTSGIISETEAYGGVTDKASHAYGGRHTERTKTMYAVGGTTYVYLCYGIHNLFNVVTNQEGIPHAILIRGIVPDAGIDLMKERRKFTKTKGLADGPGKLSKAMGIDLTLNNHDLFGEQIWIEESGHEVSDNLIKATPRIGIDYAEEHKDLPWRFLLTSSKAVQ